MRGRLGLFAIGVVGSILAAGAPSRAADQVSVQLDWVVRGNHAMFFVARDKGFFQENGIEVTAIRKGTGSPDAMRLVANGNAEFGFGDLPTLAVARSQNVPAVALVAVNQRSPLAMLSLAKTIQLRKPSDLKGLNIGIHPAGSTYIFFRAFLAANGLTEADMKLSTVSPPYENYLLLGRVQAVPGYIDAEVPELEAKAGGTGSLSIMLGADFGYAVYGSGMFTSDKMVREKPDLVKRFTAAYMKAFRFVIDNPKDAVEIVVKANPEHGEKREVLLKQIEADIRSTFTSEETRTHGLGSMSVATWGQTVKVLKEQGALKVDVKPEEAFAGKFLD